MLHDGQCPKVEDCICKAKGACQILTDCGLVQRYICICVKVHPSTGTEALYRPYGP